jgi:saccharopine dehydrogenase-like NADP-dependent oxidoreductase
MKVFALGGYGKTGIPAIKLLAQSDMVTQIAIAGRNLEHAEKVAAEIGEKTVAIEADGIDEEKLTSCLAGYDILMNAATNEAVLPAIRAAIHNGAHYCDMAAGPILEQALKLSSEAKTAGITSIIANGIHPSNTNLMGVHVARQLDEVEQLQLGEASIYHFQTVRELTPRQWLGDPKESLTPLYDYKYFLGMMMQMVQKNGIRTVLDYQDGRWVEVDPVRNGLEIPLPQGGTMTADPTKQSPSAQLTP